MTGTGAANELPLVKGVLQMENNWLHISDLPKEAGVTQPLSLLGRPALKEKNRVHILALGDVGRTMLIGAPAPGVRQDRLHRPLRPERKEPSAAGNRDQPDPLSDRKSTRLNSSH